MGTDGKMADEQQSSRRTLILTGASRGIGHATVKRFSSAGWRGITCSRRPFPADCPWEAGPEDHIQIDLASREDLEAGIAELRARLDGGILSALVNNAGISPKGADGQRLGTLDWTGGLARQIPLRRLGSPEEVASTICFLYSPQTSYVTGTEVHMNGGQHV